METANLIVLKVLAGNDVVSLNFLQELMIPHIEMLTICWYAIWCTTAFVVLLHLFSEWRKARS
jgi:hypothetical protein